MGRVFLESGHGLKRVSRLPGSPLLAQGLENLAEVVVLRNVWVEVTAVGQFLQSRLERLPFADSAPAGVLGQPKCAELVLERLGHQVAQRAALIGRSGLGLAQQWIRQIEGGLHAGSIYGFVVFVKTDWRRVEQVFTRKGFVPAVEQVGLQ